MKKTRFGHVDIPFKRIHIELTNICDFNCVFCPKSRMTRKYGHMDATLAKDLLTTIAKHKMADKVTFHVMGEPTLHPKFFEILDHAASLSLPVGLTTNAGGLGKKVGERLLDYPLQQLDVSMQTPDEQSFALRKAGNLQFTDYLEGILSFFHAYRTRHPETVFKFRILNTRFRPKAMERKTGPIKVMSNARELHETFSYWVDRIYDMLEVDDEARALAHKRINKLASFKWNVVEILPNTFFETYLLADWGHAFDDAPVRDAWAGYCFGMRDHFAILQNGDVVLCCIDFDGKTVVGNVCDNTLEEVLAGEELGKIMRGFRRFKPVHPYCKRCLGSRNLLSWISKPFAGVVGLSLLKPYFYKKTRLFK